MTPKYDSHTTTCPGQKVSNMLLGKSIEKLLIAPERMKQLGQSRNDAQLRMYLVVKVKFDVVQNNVAQESRRLGP